jgi:hypothetical protein
LLFSKDDGIVVWGSQKGYVAVDSEAVPVVLREQLGIEATNGLVRLFRTAEAEWTAQVLNLSLERFERRLVEEVTVLRVEMANGQTKLREEIAQASAAVRVEMAAVRSRLEGDIAALGLGLNDNIGAVGSKSEVGIAGLRGEMREGFATIRQEMAAGRFELLKWSFLFWVGQLLVMVGVIGAMMRLLRP